jgi:AcrR family transcriptional regulator
MLTRETLLNAAEIVFAEKGFYRATLDDIATRAGFTKGAVYSNFRNKEDLLLELLNRRIDQQIGVVNTLLGSDTPDASGQFPSINELVEQGAFFNDETWGILSLEFRLYALRHPDVRHKLADLIQRERELVQRLFDHEYPAVDKAPRYPTHDIAVIALALFDGLGSNRLLEPSSVTRDVLQTAQQLLGDAIGLTRSSAGDHRP